MDLQGLGELFKAFVAAPLGKAVLFSLLMVVCLILYIIIRRGDIADAHDKREAELEKTRIENKRQDDERRSRNEENTTRLIGELTINIVTLTTIVGRLETDNTHNAEMLRDVSKDTAALRMKADVIHTNVIKAAKGLYGEIKTSRVEDEQRTAEVKNAVKELDADHFIQNGLIEQVLNRLKDVGNSVTNVSASTNELHRLSVIEGMLRDLADDVTKIRKGTGDLSTKPVPTNGQRDASTTPQATQE